MMFTAGAVWLSQQHFESFSNICLFCISTANLQQTESWSDFLQIFASWHNNSARGAVVAANMHGKYWTENYGGPDFWLPGKKAKLN